MTPIQKVLQSERTVAVAIALLAAAAVLGARGLGLLETVELAVHDRILRLMPDPEEPGRRVMVVGYTEHDIMEQGVYPIPDATLARVLSLLLSHDPRGVGVDFYRDVLIPPGSEELEEVLRSDPRIVMIELVSDGDKPAIPPPAVLEGTHQTGFSDLQVDRDATVRRALLYTEDENDETILSMALQVALRWLDDEGVQLGVGEDGQLRLGETVLTRFREDDGSYVDADDAGYQLMIEWDGEQPFHFVSMADVLEGRVDEEQIRDRMVFVGALAESVADLRHVPFGVWPGIFVHGHIASQLARYGMGEDSPLRTVPELAEAAWVIGWSVLGAALGLARGSVFLFAASLLGGVGLLAGLGIGALVANWWIPVVPPAATWLASAAAVTAYVSRREHAERAMLMQLFSRHVSSRVAEDLWEKRHQFMEGGRPRPQRQMITVFFVDVKSFTPIAERLDALELTTWVNDLMGALAQEVERHGGFVDDYFGDGMKADFGVPVPRGSEEEQNADAVAAVRCAMAMEHRLAELNASWSERDMPTGRLRVGIDSGFAVAGSIGSSDRLKYTVLGDTANTAARIEGLDDSAHDFERKPVRILVSARARERLGDVFHLDDRGEWTLKGKAQKIRVFEVLGEADDVAEEASGPLERTRSVG